jgi:hypothetical protein
MKFAAARPYADPEKAARKLIEIANTVEAVRDGRIHVEKINWPFLQATGNADEYCAGLKLAIDRGWLVMHESGTYAKFTQEGADLFA